MLLRSKYQTNAGRVLFAFLLATVAGSFLTSVFFSIHAVINNEFHGSIIQGVAMSAFAFSYTFLIWLVCIVFLGGPVWLVLHYLGLRHWIVAAIAGAMIPSFLVAYRETEGFSGMNDTLLYSKVGDTVMWQDGVMTQAGWENSLFLAVLFGIAGLVVGLVLWRVAYTPKPETH